MAKRSITVRIEEVHAEALESMARKSRKETGDPVGLSDLVRAAVREYLDSQEVESEARN